MTQLYTILDKVILADTKTHKNSQPWIRIHDGLSLGVPSMVHAGVSTVSL